MDTLARRVRGRRTGACNKCLRTLPPFRPSVRRVRPHPLRPSVGRREVSSLARAGRAVGGDASIEHQINLLHKRGPAAAAAAMTAASKGPFNIMDHD